MSCKAETHGRADTMGKQTIEQQVIDYITENFDAEDWDVEGIVDEIAERGYESIDDMDVDELTDILQANEN